jgi:hypothetical protein
MNFLERYSLAGKVAVVTGAARGLGEGYAHGLAAAGAKVVCADINTGMISATPMVAVRPGVPPTRTPNAIEASQGRRIPGRKTERTTSIKRIASYHGRPDNPAGSWI